MKKKNIKQMAEQIVNLEKEMQINPVEAFKKLEEISKTISLEEMLKIDDYITKQNLLTK